jgi:hypothetical protein
MASNREELVAVAHPLKHSLNGEPTNPTAKIIEANCADMRVSISSGHVVDTLDLTMLATFAGFAHHNLPVDQS